MAIVLQWLDKNIIVLVPTYSCTLVIKSKDTDIDSKLFGVELDVSLHLHHENVKLCCGIKRYQSVFKTRTIWASDMIFSRLSSTLLAVQVDPRGLLCRH